MNFRKVILNQYSGLHLLITGILKSNGNNIYSHFVWSSVLPYDKRFKI